MKAKMYATLHDICLLLAAEDRAYLNDQLTMFGTVFLQLDREPKLDGLLSIKVIPATDVTVEMTTLKDRCECGVEGPPYHHAPTCWCKMEFMRIIPGTNGKYVAGKRVVFSEAEADLDPAHK